MKVLKGILGYWNIGKLGEIPLFHYFIIPLFQIIFQNNDRYFFCLNFYGRNAIINTCLLIIMKPFATFGIIFR